MTKQSNKIERKQKILYRLVFAVAAVIIVGFTYILFDEKPEVKRTSAPIKVDIPTDSMNPQAVLNDKVESNIEHINARVALMEDFLLDAKEKEEVFLKENAELRNQLIQLKEQSKNKANLSSFERKMEESLASNEEPDHPFVNDPFAAPPSCEPRRGIVVKIVEKKRSMIKNVETTIPSGTTVKAVLVSSVDAPCGVYSSSDPQPVKLQILDDGHLPKHVRAKLKGGVIIASAYGDLSSERLYIRVERLTQMKPSGDFVDTTITGFITGEDGKYGVRGTVVDKSFKLIGNAAFTGALSGVNSFFQAYASSYTNCGGYAPFCGDGNGEVSGKEFTYGLAAQGGTSGVDNALNALTDFYIKRAELIKPVLQVSAGRIVDLTFSMSTEIGDIHAQDKAERIRMESRT